MVSRSALEQDGQLDAWGDYIPATSSMTTSQENLQTCWLNQFSALKISGPDAERFLQGQLTCNVSDITVDTAHYGACCTAKGRIVANFNISFDGINYWLVLPASSADILEKHLQKYKVFFKANIKNCQQSHLILGQWTNGGIASHNHNVHRLVLSESRSLVIIEEDSSYLYNLSPTRDWRLADIAAGLYYVEGSQVEQWIPQHINWHLIGGVSFSKGCYTGQEIVARLQYLGKTKKALYYYRFEGTKTLPVSSELLSAKNLFDLSHKPQGDILMLRSQSQEQQNTLDLLVVSQGENPAEVLYLTESPDFPLTLQNLPYTIEKDT
jgi:hypothetical protein